MRVNPERFLEKRSSPTFWQPKKQSSSYVNRHRSGNSPSERSIGKLIQRPQSPYHSPAANKPQYLRPSQAVGEEEQEGFFAKSSWLEQKQLKLKEIHKSMVLGRNLQRHRLKPQEEEGSKHSPTASFSLERNTSTSRIFSTQNLIFLLASRWFSFCQPKGLLYLLQMAVLCAVVFHYTPQLKSLYNDQYTYKLLLSSDEAIDQLLSDDILQNQSGIGGGSSRTALETGEQVQKASMGNAANLSGLIDLNPTQFSTQSYTVQNGESISLIAARYGLKMSSIISVNHIERAKSLRSGQKILIPNMDGINYTIKSGDSIESIAKKYNVAMGPLIDANDLKSEKLAVGSQIFIPGAGMTRNELKKVFGDLFIYPARGRITSRFGYRSNPFSRSKREFHDGLDIAGPVGLKVGASADGVVVARGNHTIYGNYIILQHDKGIKTLYGHLSKILVDKGQRVMQGARIGLMGSTGRSTGSHVHFSIFVGGKPVNPADYLDQ